MEAGLTETILTFIEVAMMKKTLLKWKNFEMTTKMIA